MRRVWKIWEGGLTPAVIHYIETDSMDDAFAEVRKMHPGVNSAQRCTDEEVQDLWRCLAE